MNKIKMLFGMLIAGLMVLSLAACYNVPSDMTAIQMAGGLEDPKPKGCVPPGSRSNTPGNDTYVFYPISEREWDATGQKGSDGGTFVAVTDDNVEMKIPVTIRFSLISDCKTVTDFHLKYGRRYGVVFEENGDYNGKWITLLRKLVKDPASQALDRIVQGYKWRDVWNDPQVKSELEDKMGELVPTMIDRQAKGEYFEGISVLIGKPKPKEDALAKAVALEQTNVAKSQSARAQAEADAAKARAQVAVAEAEAAKRRAEVAGYGGPENYLKALCIQENPNCNPWQPTVLGYGSNPR